MLMHRALTTVAIFLAVSGAADADGFVVLDFGGNAEDKIAQMRVAANGRLYVLVNTQTPDVRCGIYGLDSSGTLVPDFGTGGRLDLLGPCVLDLAVRGASSLVIGGDPISPGLSITTRDTNGTVEASTVAATLGGSPFALAVQQDGKLLLAGRSSARVPSTRDWKIWRWNADGSIDLSFNGSGTTDYSVGLDENEFV